MILYTVIYLLITKGCTFLNTFCCVDWPPKLASNSKLLRICRFSSNAFTVMIPSSACGIPTTWRAFSSPAAISVLFTGRERQYTRIFLSIP